VSWRCLRFRAAFTPGGLPRAAARQHRQDCPACAAWAALLEGTAAAPRAPLPEALRGRLRAIPLGRRDPAPLLPPSPLPEPLRRRLQAIARQAPAAPPLWIVQARYAVAASTLLVTLAGAAFGNPLDHGRRWTRQVGDQVEQAQDRGWERLAAIREQHIAPWRAAAAGWLARVGEALAAAPARAGALLDDIPGRFDFHSPDSRGDHETDRTAPQGPSVRPLEENPHEP
jgi:hypothetical protein